ncbi:MAG: hypothetical protein IJT98_03955 [Prevotella sp.]|nr:hypothetical protein [Prevotella sp.]
MFTNPLLDDEDLLISYDEEMKAEPGGSVALVKFHHALSSIRVVVNISGFSSSSTAADNAAVVSDMRLLISPPCTSGSSPTGWHSPCVPRAKA